MTLIVSTCNSPKNEYWKHHRLSEVSHWSSQQGRRPRPEASYSTPISTPAECAQYTIVGGVNVYVHLSLGSNVTFSLKT